MTVCQMVGLRPPVERRRIEPGQFGSRGANVSVCQENAMYRLLLSAAFTVALQGANAAAGELPTFELSGFPVSRHQAAVLGSANVDEQAFSPTLIWRGMPASPHQVAILTPRRRVLGEQMVSDGPQTTAQAGFSAAVAREKAR
jgi:hypothetical protein